MCIHTPLNDIFGLKKYVHFIYFLQHLPEVIFTLPYYLQNKEVEAQGALIFNNYSKKP